MEEKLVFNFFKLPVGTQFILPEEIRKGEVFLYKKVKPFVIGENHYNAVRCLCDWSEFFRVQTPISLLGIYGVVKILENK